MSDNWIVQNLNSALSTWSEKMAELWTLLTENPATFKGGGIWRIMTNINDALTAIAYGLLVLFFAAGIIKTCGSFTDIKKPEHVLKAFIRFALAQGAITYGMELMQALFSIVQGIVTTVMSGSGMAGSVTELPTEIVDKIETFDILMFYIEDYKELIIGQEYLFINVSGDYVGKPFKGSGVYAMLRRLERKTGIKASPHMLRHYFANARRKDGWKLEMISQALGHRNIETTMKYLNITEDELIEVSDAFYNRHQAMYGVQNLL